MHVRCASLFENEFPFRNLPDKEWSQASAAVNCYVPERTQELLLQNFTRTNIPAHINVQARPQYHTGPELDHPAKLFKDRILLTKEHGEFIDTIIQQNGRISRTRTLPTVDGHTLLLNGAQFWDLMVLWVKLERMRLQRALSGDSSHHDDLPVSQVAIPESEVTRPEFCGVTYDLRRWWEARGNGKSAKIHPVRQGDERRPLLNTAGLRKLSQFVPCPDRDIVDMAAVSGFDIGAEGERMYLLTPNAEKLFKSKYIRTCVEKVEAELEAGTMQGLYPGPCYCPFNTIRNSYITQKNKDRRIGQGDAPYGAFSQYSINANVDLSRFPELNLPSVFEFSRNIAIADTLYQTTKLPQHRMEQLYTDWVAYYRSLIQMIYYAYMVCVILHPGGVASDMAMFFGLSSAPVLANRGMDMLLFYWAVLLLILLDQCSTWDVAANDGRGGFTEPGHANMLRLVIGEYDAELAQELVQDIPMVDAIGWDEHPLCRQWRQRRFQQALASGLSTTEAFWNSLPLTMHGFYDDAFNSVIQALMPTLIGCGMRTAQLTGVGMSIEKMTWAKPGVVAKPRPLVTNPVTYEHLSFVFSPGNAVVLGREFNNVLNRIFDTTERTSSVCDRIYNMCKHVAVDSECAHRNIGFQKFLSLLGIIMFIVYIRPDLRAMLNSSWRCVGAAVQVWEKRNKRNANRRYHGPQTAILSCDAANDLLELAEFLRTRQGYCFAPTTLPAGATNPLIYIMNDSAGRSSVVGDTSFRGGGVWIFSQRLSHIFWSNVAWTEGQLDKHSTETEMANANCSLESLIEQFPGFDFVEVLDNQAACQTLRRLSCKSESIERQLKFRLETLRKMGKYQRVWTVWSQREDGTLADMLSKNDLPGFRQAATIRGLPKALPFARFAPRF